MDAPDPSGPSDDELLRAFAAGRSHAFDVLVSRYGARVRAYLGRVLLSDDLADDLTQNVFVKLMERGPFRADEPELIVWLLHVARNEALDSVRRRAVHTRLARSVREGVGRLAARLRRRQESPRDALARSEFMGALEVALTNLPEPQRSAFLLRERDGLSYEQIGAVLECSTKTVSSRLHRARLALREELSEHLESGDA